MPGLVPGMTLIECRVYAGMSQAHDYETVLDLRGLLCPIPVLRAKTALRRVPVGGILVLECTDPLTVIDIPHFVTQTGHALDGQEQSGGLYVFRIVKRHDTGPGTADPGTAAP